MLRMHFITRTEDLSETEWQALRDQGVCLDDWDYILVVFDAEDQFEYVRFEYTDWHDSTVSTVEQLLPKDYFASKLLPADGGHWVKARLQDQTVILGISYH